VSQRIKKEVSSAIWLKEEGQYDHVRSNNSRSSPKYCLPLTIASICSVQSSSDQIKLSCLCAKKKVSQVPTFREPRLVRAALCDVMRCDAMAFRPEDP